MWWPQEQSQQQLQEHQQHSKGNSNSNSKTNSSNNSGDCRFIKSCSIAQMECDGKQESYASSSRSALLLPNLFNL